MSESATGDDHKNDASSMISEDEDMKMFQAARRTGRRNALGDVSEHLPKVDHAMPKSDVEKIAPHFQSMSIKH